MEKKTILEEIVSVETKLLEVSKKIKKAKEFGSIESWIEHVLKEDLELAKHFVFPTDARIRKSLLTLVTTNSPLTRPIISLLSTRIASYIATIEDLRSHPMIGPAVTTILDDFQPLVELVQKYDIHFEQSKNIQLIRQALENSRLHLYQSYAQEPPLRIVLKTLQLDKSRDDRDSLQFLLKFLFDQLKKDLAKKGFISQPRHGWWALLDLLVESDPDWLSKNSKDLNRILRSFLSATEYVPRASDLTSVVPEMNSTYNEEIWVTINMMRLYRTRIGEVATKPTINQLRTRIESNLRGLIGKRNDGSIRSNQCKLLLLYDSLEYLKHTEVVKLCNEDRIDLRHRCIGTYFWDDEIVDEFRRIRSSINTLMANRKDWTKHILSSLLISGPTGSGKSELMRQIIDEIKKTAKANSREFDQQFFTIGKEMKTQENLEETLKSLQASVEGSNLVRVVAFDEFDKAEFDFPISFLDVLASGTRNEEPVTFWIFGQSTYSTFNILQSYANSLEGKTLRDFLTRLQLGKIDLAELKASPQQRILTALGYAISKEPDLKSVSRRFVAYFAGNEALGNSRQVIKDFESYAFSRHNKLSLKNVNFRMDGIAKNDNEWMTIIR